MGEFQGVPEQDRDDDRGRVEGEDVLETVEGEFADGEHLVDRMRFLVRELRVLLSGDSCHLCLAFRR
ncbi:hypothetical protein HEK616_49410 [Streptomyces nigrescens]|uniref:Uncharacterized protein n=1 Tax=Streptomyces nigrescens TaxID=1920 RepID=A0ABN6QZ14_STRNI|nr:hypothetical protein HEK616_49410 [Streptomyces nigrescens]